MLGPIQPVGLSMISGNCIVRVLDSAFILNCCPSYFVVKYYAASEKIDKIQLTFKRIYIIYGSLSFFAMLSAK